MAKRMWSKELPAMHLLRPPSRGFRRDWAASPRLHTEPSSQTRSLGRNPSLVLHISPRDTRPRPHGEVGCGEGEGGRVGDRELTFPSTIGILGQNMCSSSDARACTEVSWRVLERLVAMTGVRRGLKKKRVSKEEAWASRSITCYLLSRALKICSQNGI